jgi:hypothetical protein
MPNFYISLGYPTEIAGAFILLGPCPSSLANTLGPAGPRVGKIGGLCVGISVDDPSRWAGRRSPFGGV